MIIKEYHVANGADSTESKHRFQRIWDSIDTPVSQHIKENSPTKWGSSNITLDVDDIMLLIPEAS